MTFTNPEKNVQIISKPSPIKKTLTNDPNDLQMTLNDLQITLVAKISVPLVFTRQMAQNGPKHIHILT